jgi:hypothetical protein
MRTIAAIVPSCRTACPVVFLHNPAFSVQDTDLPELIAARKGRQPDKWSGVLRLFDFK